MTICPDLNFDVEEHVLENGTRLLLLPNTNSQLVTCMLWVPAGVRTERAGESGLSHFVEHCYSLGSQNFGPREIDRLVQRLGGRKNAFTSYDYTAYYATLPPDGLATLIEAEADRLANLLMPEERVRKELEVVLEERRLRIDNAPTGRLYERLFQLAYDEHAYRHPIIGTSADLRAFDRESAFAYYQRHYQPANVAFVVSGHFEADDVLGLFRTHVEPIASGPRPVIACTREPEQHDERRDVLIKRSERLARCCMLFKVPGMDHEDYAALSVFETLVLHGETSRVDRKLRRGLQLATYVGGGGWGLQDTSPFVIEAEARPGVDPEALEQGIEDVLYEVADHGVDVQEVDIARARISLDLLTSLESSAARARSAGRFAVTSGESWTFIRDQLARIADVSCEDVRRVAGRYFGRAQRSVCYQLPPTMEGQAHALSQVRGPDSRSLDEHCHGEGYRWRLDNGVVVLCQRVPHVPTVTLSVAVRGASAIDPAGKSGLAALVATALRTGTANYSEQALHEAFAKLGGSLRSRRLPDWIQLATALRRHDVGAGLDLLLEAVRRPEFAVDKVQRVRSELLAERRAVHSRPGELLIEAFYQALYGDSHPYGLPLYGSEHGIEASSVYDMRSFHARNYRPEETVIVAVGDLEPAQFADLVARAVADWKPSGEPVGKVESFEVPPRMRSGVAVEKADQTQVYLRMGQVAVARDHAQWPALTLGTHVLGGGGLGSRLAQRVRTEAGLAYSVHAFLIPRFLPGAFGLAAQTRNDACEELVDLLQAELRRVIEEPATADELDRSKAQLRSSLLFRKETNAARVATLIEGELFGLGPRHIEEEIEVLSALNAEDVAQAWQANLDAEALALSIVAPGEVGTRLLDAWQTTP